MGSLFSSILSLISTSPRCQKYIIILSYDIIEDGE